MALLAVVLAVILGWAIVRVFAEDLWIILSAGPLVGMGASSCLFFLCRLAVPSQPRISIVLEVGVLAGLLWLGRNRAISPGGLAKGWLNLTLAGVTFLSIVLATGVMVSQWALLPDGAWDSWAIWSLRAKFLASGEPSRAWSGLLTGTHPEYPLLVSGFIARSFSPAASQALSYLAWLQILALGGVAVARLRGTSLGFAFALTVCVTPLIVSQVPLQYADVPLAGFMCSAVALALLDQPVLAGAMAGFAAWTKDEGLLFCVVFLLLSVIFKRTAALRAIAGAVPGLAIALWFKAFLAPAGVSLLATSSSGAGARVGDLSRYGQIVSGLAGAFGAVGWFPIAIVVLAGIAAGIRKDKWAQVGFAGAVCIAMLAGYAGIYAITSSNLAWQIGTTANRLAAQIWPCVVLAVFLLLRDAEA